MPPASSPAIAAIRPGSEDRQHRQDAGAGQRDAAQANRPAANGRGDAAGAQRRRRGDRPAGTTTRVRVLGRAHENTRGVSALSDGGADLRQRRVGRDRAEHPAVAPTTGSAARCCSATAPRRGEGRHERVERDDRRAHHLAHAVVVVRHEQVAQRDDALQLARLQVVDDVDVVDEVRVAPARARIARARLRRRPGLPGRARCRWS